MTTAPFDVDSVARPTWDIPAGHAWVVEADDDWSTSPMSASPVCRRPKCSAPSVAWLRRGLTRPQWWGYCADHMYGRWVDGDVVKHWVVRRQP